MYGTVASLTHTHADAEKKIFFSFNTVLFEVKKIIKIIFAKKKL